MVKRYSSGGKSRVSQLQEVYLTLGEVQEYISAFERHYGFSSEEFIRDPGRHAEVSEDDAFDWEAYLDHRAELQRMDEKVRRDYLARLSRRSPKRSLGPDSSWCLAA